MTMKAIDRRTVLSGAAMVGAGAVLTACGDTSGDTTTAGMGNASQMPSVSTAEVSLGNAADVPVGGGVIYSKQTVVVTQPTAGTFKAFSAECTHQGCLVTEVKGKAILCRCHGSSFSITDGSVLDGPASEPLPAKNVTASGGKLVLA